MLANAHATHTPFDSLGEIPIRDSRSLQRDTWYDTITISRNLTCPWLLIVASTRGSIVTHQFKHLHVPVHNWRLECVLCFALVVAYAH